MKENYLEQQQVTGDFVFLRADNLRLLFPLSDVINTGYAQTSDGDHHRLNDAPNTNEGYVTHENVAISGDLTTLPLIPDDRFILVQMNGLDVRLCWNEMTIIKDRLLMLTHIPTQFLNKTTPLRTLVTIDENPVFLCDTTMFLSYLFPEKVSII